MAGQRANYYEQELEEDQVDLDISIGAYGQVPAVYDEGGFARSPSSLS